MTANTMLGMTLGGGELLIIAGAIVWILTLAQCWRRKQFIWFAAVLLTVMIGTVAYWIFARDSRPAAQA